MKYSLEALAERIKAGIEASGAYLLHKEELALIWQSAGAETEEEKRTHLENFARYHGMMVHLGGNLTIAVFRDSN
jgi:hypothetical protein